MLNHADRNLKPCEGSDPSLRSGHAFARFSGLLVLLLLAFCLVCCTGQSRQEISFVFQTSAGAAAEPYWKEVIADFEAKYPQYQVNLKVIDWANGSKYIEDLIQQGRPPALARVTTVSIPGYVAKGLVEPMEGYMSADFKNQFAPVLINEGAQYQGRTFGLPIAVSVRGLYYNKELFERAGINAPPKTWDELRDTAIKISKLSSDVYGFGIQGRKVETSTYFYYFLWSNGGEVLSPDGTRATFNSAEVVEALTFLSDLVDASATQPDPTKDERTDLENGFAQGKYGMIIGPNKLAKRLDTEGKIRYDVTLVPYKKTPNTLAVEDTLILFRQADYKEVAWKFVEFIYQDKYRLQYIQKVENVVPEKLSIAADPQLTSDRVNSFFMQQLLPIARFEPVNTKSTEMADIVTQEVQAAYKKAKMPKAALDAAVGRINEQLGYSAAAW